MNREDQSAATPEIDRAAPVQAAASVFIAAPPESVWSVLADIASWPDWNPDVARTALHGPLEVGSRFDWKAGGMPIRSVLMAVSAPGVLAWTGTTMGIRAVHVSRFVARDDGTEAVTEESFAGILPSLFRGAMRGMLKKSLAAGLASLKAESERRARAG